MKMHCAALCLLALLPLSLTAHSQATDSKATSYKGLDCSTLSSRSDKSDCTTANYEVKTFYLGNATAQNDANELVTALRNMFDPATKIYLVANENAVAIGTYPQEIARIEALAHELDKPKKTYRLTYTVAVLEDGKNIGTQHFSIVALDGQRTTMKEGDKIPVATGTFSTENNSAQTQFTYLDVGMNFDATVNSTGGGVTLKTKVEQSSIGPTNTIAGVAEPVVRQSVLEGVSIAPLGKPFMLGSIDIPNSNRHLNIDILIDQIK
jgi:type II secretory pathway component GspD/PulD (secretin)